jgi:hypothetical protein
MSANNGKGADFHRAGRVAIGSASVAVCAFMVEFHG